MGIEILLKLASPIVTLIIGFIINKYFQNRPKLITYLVQASEIPLKDGENTIVNTHSVVVRNDGKRTAHNVRVGHTYLPDSFSIFPKLMCDISRSEDDNSAEIIIPTLVPNEQISISYLYFPPYTWHKVNSYCKSDEMHAISDDTNAKYLDLSHALRLSNFRDYLSLFFLFIGISTFLYWIFIVIWTWAN